MKPQMGRDSKFASKQQINLRQIYRIRTFWNKELNTKSRMHNTRERAITDRLCPEIDTLNLVLNEILVLSQRSQG
jgi:hypothetical protein